MSSARRTESNLDPAVAFLDTFLAKADSDFLFYFTYVLIVVLLDLDGK